VRLQVGSVKSLFIAAIQKNIADLHKPNTYEIDEEQLQYITKPLKVDQYPFPAAGRQDGSVCNLMISTNGLNANNIRIASDMLFF
jgi:hypothetical protein